MEVPTAHGLPSEVRDQQVAGSDDGVRPLGVWREAVPRPGQPGQGLLGQVLDEVLVTSARGQGPPDHGLDVGQRFIVSTQPPASTRPGRCRSHVT